MALSASLLSSVPAPSSAARTDVRVQHLEAQIQDWATCPTTDPSSKREIVGRLSNQLQGVEADISKQSGSSDNGLGGQLNLTA